MPSHSLSSRSGHPPRTSAKVLPFPTAAQRRGAPPETKQVPSKAVTRHREALQQLRQAYLEQRSIF